MGRRAADPSATMGLHASREEPGSREGARLFRVWGRAVGIGFESPLRLRTYTSRPLRAPRDRDLQTPHSRDELYVVARGSGTFFDGRERWPFEPGALLFVAAGRPHRFEDFSEALAVRVVFFGSTAVGEIGSTRAYFDVEG